MIHIQTLPLGALQANCYVVWGDDPRTVAVIDPGDDAAALQTLLRGKMVTGALITHAHFDHILGLPALAGVPVYVHALDAAAMTDAALNCAEYGSALPRVPATHTVAEGDTVALAGLEFYVLHTPGHTPGGVCYLCENHLFTGDTLFAGGYGRTDLPGGDWSALRASLRRLLELPADLIIHPGHGASCPLGVA